MSFFYSIIVYLLFILLLYHNSTNDKFFIDDKLIMIRIMLKDIDTLEGGTFIESCVNKPSDMITVIPSGNTITIELNIPTEEITVNSWIGLYDYYNEDNTRYITYEYIKARNSITMQNLYKGHYEIRYFKTKQYNYTYSKDFWLGEKISVLLGDYIKGSQYIDVSIDDKTVTPSDWVGLYSMDNKCIAYSYLNVQHKYTKLNMPNGMREGKYHVRYFKLQRNMFLLPHYLCNGESKEIQIEI